MTVLLCVFKKALVLAQQFKGKAVHPLPLLLVVFSLLPGVSHALEKVSLQLKYLHQFQFAGYYAALHQGYYRDAGLEVTIVEGGDGHEPERNVLSGEAQYGVGSSSLLLSHHAGKPLVVLGVIFQHSPYTLLTSSKDATLGIQHIVGKRVMIAPQADEIIAYLNKERIPLDSIEQLTHSFDPEDLIQGRVDAISAYVTNEINYLKQAGFPFQAFSPRSVGIDFYGDNLFTSKQELKQHPKRVEAFRQASIRGWQYAMSHKEEIIELILTQYSQQNSREHLLYEANQMEPLVQPVLVEIGYMNPGRWRHIADIYAELDMLPRDYQFNDFIYDSEASRDMFWWYVTLASLILVVVIISGVYFTSIAKERKRARKELEFKNILLSTQQEVSIDGLLAVNCDGMIISANQRLFELWGVSQAAMTSQTDACFLAAIEGKLNNPSKFLHRVDELNQQRNAISSEEIALEDGRMFDRYTAPIVTQDGQYFGRMWSYRDISERKASEQLIWNQANLDFLTGLPNRYLLHFRLEHELQKAKRSGKRVALMFLDLDRFKEVNDTLGHDIGDLLIQDTAKRLCHCVRGTDTVARLGGDEFTVILGDLDQYYCVERIASQILCSLSKPFVLGDEMAYISASIGITFYPDDGNDVESLLKNADQAMYAAKEQGRNGLRYFTPEMQDRAIDRRHLANDLRQALAKNQFRLFYQPVVELATSRVIKAEALIRWQHPERGLVSPNDFIAIAEETGMINDIGNWVFEQAAIQTREWRKIYNTSFQMSFNASPVQFSADINLTKWFGYLEQLGLPGSALVVEITEGLLMEAKHHVRDKLLAFRDGGIEIALDDFGTGYSSLSYLKRFDIDYLKIDQAFVRNLTPQSDDLALCEAIIVMAHKLGITVIAEGVETEQQKQLLAAAGCDYAQGYLFSRPIPCDEFEQLFTTKLTGDREGVLEGNAG